MRVGIAFAVAVPLVLAGCHTVDPLTMDRTERDEESYEAPASALKHGGQQRVYVVSRIIAHQRASETNHLTFLAKAVESSAAQYFSNLGWFRTIDRQNGLTVDANAALAGTAADAMSGVPREADYALVVESSVQFIAKQGWKMTSHSKKARGVQVESDFRLVAVHERDTVAAMRFRSTVECGKGEVRTALSEAANMNVRKFARVVSARHLPPGRVTETRGSGRCARLSIGKNYLLSAGVGGPSATRVDFFEYDPQRKAADGRSEKVVIAHGTVISADKNEAWVEVDADWINKTTHLATYNVKKGHFVKISEEAVENETEVD